MHLASGWILIPPLLWGRGCLWRLILACQVFKTVLLESPNYMEHLTLVVLVTDWRSMSIRSKCYVQLKKSVSVAAVNGGRSRDSYITCHLRQLAIILVTFNRRVKGKHLPGKDNISWFVGDHKALKTIHWYVFSSPSCLSTFLVHIFYTFVHSRKSPCDLQESLQICQVSSGCLDFSHINLNNICIRLKLKGIHRAFAIALGRDCHWMEGLTL